MKKDARTRVLNDRDLGQRFREGCPHCESRLIARDRRITDEETGKEKFGGAFFGCSQYGRTCFADYSVGLDGRERNWKV